MAFVLMKLDYHTAVLLVQDRRSGFCRGKKEAEALGDNEILQAISEIERTNIELKAVKDIDSRAREDSAGELKLFKSIQRLLMQI